MSYVGGKSSGEVKTSEVERSHVPARDVARDTGP